MTWQNIAASSELLAKDITASCKVAGGSPETIILHTHCRKVIRNLKLLPSFCRKLKLTALHCQSIAGTFVSFISSPKHRKKPYSIHVIIKVFQEALSNSSHGENIEDIENKFLTLQR